MFVSPFLVGGYHIWGAALFTVVLSAYIFFEYRNNAVKNKFSVGFPILTLLLIPVFYLVVSLWAVDKATAVYGFVKFLPIALFTVIVSPMENEDRQELLNVVPVSAAVMGTLSYALSFIPVCGAYFLVSERLGGFFQSPNAFAAYCLAGIVIVLLNDKLKYAKWITAAILTMLIFLTGSRTVFIIFVMVIFALFFKFNNKNKIRLAIFALATFIISVIVIGITDNFQTVGRYLTISLESSTLNGRLLYYIDALKVILKNPFGLGYYGYYFSQGSFQTGVYSTAFVHNEFMQLLLDIGWVPGIMFLIIVIKSFFSKNVSYTQKAVLFVLFGHSLFDFDLQFLSVFFVLILTFDFSQNKKRSIKKNKKMLIACLCVAVVTSVYFAVVNVAFLLEKYDIAYKVYKGDTQSKIQLMITSDDYDTICDYADSIIEANKYVTVAYDAKANQAYMNGDIQTMVEYKNKALDCAAYSISEYNDYCEKIIPVIEIYRRAGDTESAEYCEEVLLSVKEKLKATENKTNSLAFKIKDKPNFTLNEEYEKYIEQIMQR